MKVAAALHVATLSWLWIAAVTATATTATTATATATTADVAVSTHERLADHSHSQKRLKVLLIGDSVDRNLLMDYCRFREAKLCSTIEEYGVKYNTTNCTSRGSFPDTLSSLFDFSKRIFPWGVVICDDDERDVSIGFLFNTQGVSPHPPWFWPEKSSVGLENVTYSNVREMFTLTQGPAIAPLLRGLGGNIDAYMVNSLFWDIGRLVTGELGRNGGRDICANPYMRAQFVNSWAHNASFFLKTLDSYFPDAGWKAWRTSNQIMNAIPPCRNNMVHAMNRASFFFARKLNFKWMNLFSYPDISIKMRDSHHPNSNASASFMEKVLRVIRKEI